MSGGDFAILDFFERGGAVLVAIVGFSTIAWAVLIWKWLQIRGEEDVDAEPGWVDTVLRLLLEGDRDRALSLSGDQSGLHGRIVSLAIRCSGRARSRFERQLAPILHAESAHLERHLGFVRTAATVSPLLGLLGTVIGMIKIFDSLSADGPAQMGPLSEGISETLVTTQAGLFFALPTLLGHRILLARARRCIEGATLSARRVETIVCYDETEPPRG